MMPLQPTWTDIALRLALTLLAGAVLGFNREQHGHAAGLRTTILVTLAASVAMIQMNLLLRLEGKNPGSFAVMDLMRLPLGILTGVGFLGGGAILKKGGSITAFEPPRGDKPEIRQAAACSQRTSSRPPGMRGAPLRTGVLTIFASPASGLDKSRLRSDPDCEVERDEASARRRHGVLPINPRCVPVQPVLNALCIEADPRPTKPRSKPPSQATA